MGKNNFKVRRKNRRHPVLFTVTMFICLILIGVVIFLHSKPLAPKQNIPSKGNNSTASTALTIKDKVGYYLICGMDPSNVMSDIIMLVCFDKEKDKATVLQIPRDSYVGDLTDPVYGVLTGKINTVYNQNGADANGMNKLIQYINRDFGLPVDHYIYFNPTGFVNTVNIVGGVTVDVPFDLELNGLTLYAGNNQHLNGQQAEVLVRSRKIYNPTSGSHLSYGQGDIGRLQVQKKFLAAFMLKIKNMTASQFASSIPNVFNNFKSDMTVSDIVDLGKLANKLNLKDVEIYTMPGDGVMAYHPNIGGNGPGGSDVFGVNKAEANVLINGKFNPYGAPIDINSMQIPDILTSSSSSSSSTSSTSSDVNNATPSLQDIINEQNSQQ